MAELQNNTAVFSAFKTHRQQNDIAKLLLTEDGSLKSFAQFRIDTTNLIGQYNSNWLNTEYNTAIIRARQAANFKRFEAEKDLFPNLKWVPSTSAEPRAIHQKLYGIVKPIYDEFWQDNYPGNLWGCKCGITNTDAEVSAETINSGQSVPGLDKNPGLTGEIFTETHPYVTEGYLPKNKLKEIISNYIKTKTEIKLPTGKAIIKGFGDMTNELEIFANEQIKLLKIEGDVRIKPFNSKIAGGSVTWTKSGDNWIIDNLINVNTKEKDLKSIIAHELTHIKQGQLDGFYVNGDYFYWKGEKSLSQSEYKKIINKMKNAKTKEDYIKANDIYKKIPWEVEAHERGEQFKNLNYTYTERYPCLILFPKIK